MGIGEAAALLGVGMAAGTINVVVGSGTLVTFPTLLAFGYPPVVANVTNTVGLVSGSLSGIHGYRAEIGEFRSAGRGRLGALVLASLLGAVTGALLLLVLPAKAFKAIVPALIALALVLIVAQPRLAKRLAARREAGGDGAAVRRGGWGVLAAVFGSGVYGGYFGAAQGVLLMAILGLTYADRLQALNGVKNILACVVNAVAAVVFIAVGELGIGGEHPSVRWGAALAIAVGALIGGQIGAGVGRRLSPKALRGLIIVVGLVAIVSMLV
ncbi:MAG: sulfite exporter TauE/SafE family protein [Catenulispora sp.]